MVDDDEDSRELLAELLRTRGFTVRTEASGAACLQALGAGDDIAVVITDIEMPEMTGLELCGLMRERHPQIVAILISGRATEAISARAAAAGAFRFVPKPVNVGKLDALIREAMAA